MKHPKTLDTLGLKATIGRVTSDHMRRRFPRLPRLVWHFDDNKGVLIGQSEVDGRAEVDAWASALGLVVDAFQLAGSLQVTGEVDGVGIVVWAVTDREVWENGLAGDRR